jgi:hypothetical protein
MRHVLLVLAIGCSDPPPKRPEQPPTMTETTMNRTITPRDKLPKVVQPLLPQHGIYAAGGGLVSSAWRIVVDRDAKTIYAGTAQGPNAASFGKMDSEAKKPLSDRNDKLLTELAEAAWREPASPPSHATADYDEILIVVDGNDTFFLQGYGPIKQPKAAKVIEELRAAAGL